MSPSRTPPRLAPWPFALALTLLVFLLAPALAQASAWVAQQQVPTVNGRTQQPAVAQIGVDAAGNATLVTLVDKGPPQYVQVAGRPVGSDWQAATEIGAVQNATGGPALAVDPAGNALIAFVNSDSTAPCTGTANGCLHVVSRSPSGAIKTETLFTNGATAMSQPAVALDPSGSGQAMVIWSKTAGGNGIQGISGQIGGSWATTPVNGATTTSTISSPRVAIDRSGTPVVWYLTSVTGQFAVLGMTLSGASFTAPGARDSSTAGAFSALSVKTNRQGDVDAIWSGQTVGNKVVRTMTFDAATSSFPATAATVYSVVNTHNLNGPKIETAADGEAVAVWTDDFTSTLSVRSVLASVRSGGAWGGPITLDPNTVDTSGPALAMDAAGNATAVWHSNSPTITERYAVHPHGGSFGSSQNAPAGNSAPVVAADAAGHVHAAWAAGSTAVDTAVFDPVPPAIASVIANPAALLTGGATQLDASAGDVWSGPPSIHWDFGDGRGGDGASLTHAFSSAGTFTARATATDAAGNSSSGTADTQVTSPSGGSAARILPRPVAGKSVNVEPVTGEVLVRVPGSNQFVPLVAPTQIQDGAIIDARKGRVRITIDNGHGGLDTAEFFGGVFRFTQPKVKPGQTWFANLYLYGGSFRGCPAAPRNPRLAALSRKKSGKQSQGKSVRHLWGSGEGAFRTVGRFSSATVRGTTWLTDDRCNGTLTKVTAGKVGVRDFVRRKTIVVKKGKSYFARPKPRKKR